MATIAENLYQRFFRGSTHYALGKSNSSGQSVYTPVRGDVTMSMIEQHLMGNIVLGAYTLNANSKCTWMAFDIDAKTPEEARELTLKLHELLRNVPHVVEFSGSKGYHLLVFFRNPVEAERLKNLGDEARELVGGKRSGDLHIEVFPKQKELTDSNPLGNLLKVPLGIHPVTGKRSIFVDPDGEWEQGTPLDPIPFLEQKTTLNEFAGVIADFQTTTEAELDQSTRIINILKNYWLSGQRHELALAISGYLCQIGWAKDAVDEIVERLQQEVGGDLNNLLACVADTFRNYEEGKAIQGIQGLSQFLPLKVLRNLSDVATENFELPSMAAIDRIRLAKGAHHLKVREASELIVNFLLGEGELLRDQKNMKLYWLNRQDHNLYDLREEAWDIFMQNFFGINSVEAFGRQVLQTIYSAVHEVAIPAHTHNRSWWNGEELWLNLGTTTNYVIDGKTLDINMNGGGSSDFGSKWGRTVLNGEEGVIFRNRDSTLRVDLEEAWKQGVRELDPWEFLVNDLNFGIGTTGIGPLQQRELIKAWFLSTFFPNVMPTRPLLTIVASPGAGKTTAARRFLKVLEGPQADVMGLIADKPDSLRASLASHRFVVLDNLEKTKSNWLTDLLNRISTGTHIELRRLHTTNETQIITPDCFVILTATALPFSEESLFSRILPVELAPLMRPIPEYTMQQTISDNLEGIWMGIFRVLNSVVAELNRVQTAPAPTQSRLADFSIFCARIRGLEQTGGGALDGEALIQGLEMIVNRQRALLTESSPLIQVLDIWIRDDMASHGGRQHDTEMWKTSSELNVTLRMIAVKNKMEWPWETGQALALHIRALEAHLIRLFGMRIKRGDGKHTAHEYRWEREIIATVERERLKKIRAEAEREREVTDIKDITIDLRRDPDNDIWGESEEGEEGESENE